MRSIYVTTYTQQVGLKVKLRFHTTTLEKFRNLLRNITNIDLNNNDFI